MAEIKKIVPRSAISNFQQVAPEAGGTFRALALAAETAYEKLRPAAIKKMQDAGTELGHQWARQQIGDPVSGHGNYRSAIQSVESGGNYSALGPVTKSGDRAYGAYQVMGSNVGPWTKKHLGREMTPSEFLADPEAQDAVFDAEFGSYVSRFGNPQDAASMWFSGRPLSQAGNASDGYTTVPDYVKKFSAALGPDPTIVRTSEGKLEPRLYSPMAGEILAAHDAAAGVAYTSDVMLKGAVDLMAMSEQFALDPEGFGQAARGYVDDIVKNAPERFRTDLRASLEKEMVRRFLGVTEEKQRDIRQRADNSSAALVDKWSQNLAEAMASGNKDEIDSAQAELDGLLMARESLPGVSWTPEQSANVFRKSADEAARIRKAAAVKVNAENRNLLETIIAAAKGGLHAADEARLSDPDLQSALPDLWNQAVGAVTLRDWMPSFNGATPTEQAGAIAAMKAEPIANEIQVNAIAAAESAHAENIKAWRDDPIGRAEAVLPEKPPPLPDPATATPEAIEKAFAARRAYGLRLVEDGYISTPAFLSDAEAATIGALMGKDVDPIAKTLMSSAIVKGFGPEAAQVFKEIKSDDPVTRYSGMFMAGGGDPSISSAAMRGQQMLDEGLVQTPSKAARISAVAPDIAEALAVLPNDTRKEADLVAFATAIYANNARGVDPASQKATELLASSMQTALGQSTNRRGQLTGGVQNLSGFNVLLPMGVAGDDVSSAVGKALGRRPQAFLADPYGSIVSTPEAAPDSALWGGTPMLGGKPVPAAMWDKGQIRLVPHGGALYRMEVVIDGVVTSDVRDERGNVFFFDIKKMVDASLVAP